MRCGAFQYLTVADGFLKARDDLDGSAAALTDGHIDFKNTCQSLGPRHSDVTRERCLLPLARCWRLPRTTAAFRRHDLRAQPMVGSKTAVKARQVDARAGDQGGQSRQEIQRFENDVGGAVAVRGLERVADVALGRERESLDRHRRAGNLAVDAVPFMALMGRSAGAAVRGKSA